MTERHAPLQPLVDTHKPQWWKPIIKRAIGEGLVSEMHLFSQEDMIDGSNIRSCYFKPKPERRNGRKEVEAPEERGFGWSKNLDARLAKTSIALCNLF
ncbi:unnamed protein product [Echinostoma caproni]|uniref:PWWP domain-containing protein n=1 Tax=Echinostoma caproni TaxID=27848 RepID=A0A183B1P2_9TREM|nr:unnamed protein product [Echinostoma caproni]